VPRFLEIAGRVVDRALAEIFQTECFACGRPSAEAVCPRCWKVRPVSFVAGSAVQSVLYYQEPWRSVVHAIKFQNHHQLLKLFRPWCEQADLSYLPFGTAVVPVPMHASTYRTRGFNPADYLGRWLAREHGLVFQPDCLRKVRRTAVQSTLNDEERAANPRGGYLASRPPESVLLVDDVVTTGSTLVACDQALRKAGAKQVYFWALLRADR